MMNFILGIAALCGIADFVIERIESVRKIVRKKKMNKFLIICKTICYYF